MLRFSERETFSKFLTMSVPKFFLFSIHHPGVQVGRIWPCRIATVAALIFLCTQIAASTVSGSFACVSLSCCDLCSFELKLAELSEFDFFSKYI